MLLAGVILIIGIFAVIGWRKGVMRLALSLISIIVTILTSVLIAPLITSAIKNNTDIINKMSGSIYEVLSGNEQINKYFDEKYDISIDVDADKISSYINEIAAAVEDVSAELHLPDSLGETVGNISKSDVNEISTLGKATVKEICLRVIAVRLAEVVLTAIVYIAIIVLVFVVLKIVISATGIVGRLPVIKQANKLAGLILGMLEGLVVVWLFFAIITAMSGTDSVANIMKQIKANSFLQMLYDCNPIIKLIFRTI